LLSLIKRVPHINDWNSHLTGPVKRQVNEYGRRGSWEITHILQLEEQVICPTFV